MRSLDWVDLLEHHPIFSTLGADSKLSSEEVSTERHHVPGDVIVQTGEVGESLYLIGSGSVEVVLEGHGTQQITVATLRRGDFFGEMAFFEHKPRNATVRAREACTILEIKGQAFSDILGRHPEIEFKILLKMSERLRSADAEILNVGLRDVDGQLKRLEERLDTDRKVIDAQLKASQTVFDQTKLRTDEVISAVDRTERLTKGLSAGSTAIITLLTLALGALGYREMSSIKDTAETARKEAEKVAKVGTEVQKVGTEVQDIRSKSADAAKLIAEVQPQIERVQDALQSLDKMFLRSFIQAVQSDNQADADTAYQLLRLAPKAVPQAIAVLEYELTGRLKNRRLDEKDNYGQLLSAMLKDVRRSGDYNSQVQVQYLLLANEIAVRSKDVDPTLEQLRKDLNVYKAQKTDLRKDLVQELREAFAEHPPDVKEKFERFATLVGS